MLIIGIYWSKTKSKNQIIPNFFINDLSHSFLLFYWKKYFSLKLCSSYLKLNKHNCHSSAVLPIYSKRMHPTQTSERSAFTQSDFKLWANKLWDNKGSNSSLHWEYSKTDLKCFPSFSFSYHYALNFIINKGILLIIKFILLLIIIIIMLFSFILWEPFTPMYHRQQN